MTVPVQPGASIAYSLRRQMRRPQARSDSFVIVKLPSGASEVLGPFPTVEAQNIALAQTDPDNSGAYTNRHIR